MSGLTSAVCISGSDMMSSSSRMLGSFELVAISSAVYG